MAGGVIDAAYPKTLAQLGSTILASILMQYLVHLIASPLLKRQAKWLVNKLHPDSPDN